MSVNTNNTTHTKIYGTIGPACCDADTLVRFYEMGMTGIRINLSHTDLPEAADWIEAIRAAYRQVHGEYQGADKENIPEILMDLRGPELRIGTLRTERSLETGDMLTLVEEGRNNLFDPTEIPVPGPVLQHLKTGDEILLDDGKILLEVDGFFRLQTSYDAKNNSVGTAECRVKRGGVLKSGKSIAVPGVEITAPTLTESDLGNIALAKEYGITGVMLPFVRNQEDLKKLKEELRKAGAEDIQIFAKIENLAGVKQLPELLPWCDEIVIARGDLGNAMPLWNLPMVQAQIEETCRQAGKPFMVVTQMLASMEQKPVPTRAEVSDIFRAVNDGAASVMLTGETAAGAYPVEAMEYMTKTVRAAEQYLREQ